MRPSSLFYKSLGIMLALFSLISCDTSNIDLDLRKNNYSTSSAVKNLLEERRKPDSRGVISYPNYQVAIARFGDTLESMGKRINADPQSLAEYNGIGVSERLRSGEVIALPMRVENPKKEERPITKQTPIDVTQIARNALDEPETEKPSDANKLKSRSLEPIRHKVKRGETAFTISRLYDVTIRSLSDWNALDSDFNIREGQYLLIPLGNVKPPQKNLLDETKKPGVGSSTPEPPSSKNPLPEKEKLTVKDSDLETEHAIVKAPSGGILAYPVKGKIIREYVKNKNDGIDFSAPAGTPVFAAESGTVAAITLDANQVPIIVIKHKKNLLTVYANVDNLLVQKGTMVSRGDAIGKVGLGDPSYLHFEVRNGFESVDPMDYLN